MSTSNVISYGSFISSSPIRRSTVQFRSPPNRKGRPSSGPWGTLVGTGKRTNGRGSDGPPPPLTSGTRAARRSSGFPRRVKRPRIAEISGKVLSWSGANNEDRNADDDAAKSFGLQKALYRINNPFLVKSPLLAYMELFCLLSTISSEGFFRFSPMRLFHLLARGTKETYWVLLGAFNGNLLHEVLKCISFWDLITLTLVVYRCDYLDPPGVEHVV